MKYKCKKCYDEVALSNYANHKIHCKGIPKKQILGKPSLLVRINILITVHIAILNAENNQIISIYGDMEE